MDPMSEKNEGFNGEAVPVNVKEGRDEESLGGETSIEVKVDKHGLPLIPQPSSHQDDPLVS